MSTVATDNEDLSKCAACGKGGNGLKTCNGCKLVKYCNATCQKEHRPRHKKECKKRAAELFDEALFSKSLLKGKIVQSATCHCPLNLRNHTIHAVGK